MAIDDHFDDLFDSFLSSRNASLFSRFTGPHRAVVVDTNDPLQDHRVRFKCPELHDHDVKDEDCPWAVPAPWMGGSASGSWKSYIRGDIIFIVFEKGHPYAPIYIGGADATRRERYVLDSVYVKSPPSLTEDAEIDETPEDYEEDWLPRDFRPMSDGMKDNYGNCFIMKAYGFFPKRHDMDPTPVGFDAVAEANFEANGTRPKKNEPDAKYVGIYSKYGNYLLLNDVGYDWQNEFVGDWQDDREFERKRSKYLTKSFTEQEFKDRDQRRIEFRTRYGHLMEMRDVGWGKPQGTRGVEYDDSKDIGTNQVNGVAADHRWIKWRTKGGHLFQMYDKGFDPKEDNFIKTSLEEDAPKRQFGEYMDQEGRKQDTTFFGDGFWHERKDGRFLRLVSRYGFKFVMDDRGSDTKKAEELEDPPGNGILWKGRRKGRDGKERGFGFEFNEKEKLQHVMMYSPQSKVVEINDKYGYIMMSTDTFGADNQTGGVNHISETTTKRADNEFSTKIAMGNLDGQGEIDLDSGKGGGYIPWNPEVQTHHLKLDQKNAYIRFKTHHKPGIPAGIEARCGTVGGGTGNNWTEINDHQDRGLWFSGDKKRLVLRSKTLSDAPSVEPMMWETYDEQEERIIITNNGKVIQIFCAQDVQIMAGRNLQLNADNNITMRAGGSIFMDAARLVSSKAGREVIVNGGGAQWATGNNRNGSNVPINAPIINARNPGMAKVGAGSSAGNWPVGNSTSDGGVATAVPKISRQKIDTYKPDGVTTDSYNVDRAQDDNDYESVVRKTDIWGE